MKPTTQELQVINSRLPGTTLSSAQVEVLPFRLFDSQVTDRYTRMSIEMMRKLAMDANNGLIAMNSMHQSRYTLPVGRSITGKINQVGDASEVLVKMYAVVQRPDGSDMEDGKDIADRYNTGAVYACSAGVTVGYYKCNICGNDIRDWENCDHFPGEVYKIDEKPVTCIALMTGKDIVDGVAMDCGCYECSAVTAGGVRNASVLSETFEKYDKVSDPKEFKKSQFETKNITEFVTLTPYTAKEVVMSDVSQEKELLAKNYELIEQKAKVDVELVTVKSELTATKTEFSTVKNALEALTTEFKTISDEHTKTKAALETAEDSIATYTNKVTALEAELDTVKTEFAAKLTEAETKATDFIAAYIAVITADGTKIGREADYASKTVAELQALHEEYKAEIAKLPSGQQSVDLAGETPIAFYTGIPDSFFKVA